MAQLSKSIDFLFNQMRAYQGSLAGGSIEFLSPGTTLQVPVWLDINQTQQAANPYMLSADGTAELYANGLYRIIVRNAQNVIVFDYDNVEIRPTPDTAAGGGGGGTGTDQVIHTVKSCLTNDLPSETLLETHLLQYWTRTGDSQYIMTINIPPGKLIYPNQTSVTLYSDGETMGFLYDGVQYFYPIVG